MIERSKIFKKLESQQVELALKSSYMNELTSMNIAF
jgi:hypothetical protein